MATLEAVIADVAATIAAVTGIRAAPASPDDNLNVTPFAITYPGTGIASPGVPGERLNLDSIVIELHVAKRDMPRDIATALPFVDSIPNALMTRFTTNQWSSTIETFATIEWTFQDLDWMGLQTIGFRFIVTGIKRRINNT